MNTDTLKKRFPKEHLEKRLLRQTTHSVLQFRGGFKLFWENLNWLTSPLNCFLKILGIYKRGVKNSLKYHISHHDVHLKDLPKEFDGFRILHLTDLHIEGIFDHGKKLISTIKNLKFDLCVITGDYRFLTYGQFNDCLIYTKKLIECIQSDYPILGILGNHDSIEMVPELEAIGIKMLVNESIVINRDSANIGIAGVDDQHFYDCANLETAMKDIFSSKTKILLAHSQELIEMAAESKVDLYLCGHTHGGQICLPGGVALVHNTPHRNRYFSGRWLEGPMIGYTSRGIGASCLPVRYNCLPEIVIHRLLTKS